MFLKNGLDLVIFDRKSLVFFSPKMFSRPLRQLKKVDGTPWIDPKIFRIVSNIGRLI